MVRYFENTSARSLDMVCLLCFPKGQSQGLSVKGESVILRMRVKKIMANGMKN